MRLPPSRRMHQVTQLFAAPRREMKIRPYRDVSSATPLLPPTTTTSTSLPVFFPDAVKDARRRLYETSTYGRLIARRVLFARTTRGILNGRLACRQHRSPDATRRAGERARTGGIPRVASRQGSFAGFLSEKRSSSSRREYSGIEWYRMARRLSRGVSRYQ